MKHINIAMENMKHNTAFKDEESRSIIERIIEKTGDPKIAAVLALDLFLVGVDTVSFCSYPPTYKHTNKHNIQPQAIEHFLN